MNAALSRIGYGVAAAGFVALVGGLAWSAGSGHLAFTFATPAGAVAVAGAVFLALGLALAIIGFAIRPGRPMVRTTLLSLPAIALILAAGVGVALATQSASAKSDLVSAPLAASAGSDGLVAASRATAATFPTTDAARAAGYQPVVQPNAQQAGQANRTIALYQSAANINDGKLLDPSKPEGLIFLGTDTASSLIGVVYLAPTGTGPTLDGALPAWKPVRELLAPGDQVRRAGRGQEYDGLVVWTFDHPGGPLTQSIDRDALQAAAKAAGAKPAATPAARPAVPGQPAVVPGQPAAANSAPYRRSQTGVVTSIDARTISIQTDQGSRTMQISQRTSVDFWGETTRHGQVTDVKVGNRVSVATPFQQQPDAAVSIVILG